VAANTEVTVLWDSALCGLEELCQIFEEILCFGLQAGRLRGGTSFSETVLPVHATALRHIADAPNFRRC
jgi:hypothetical protein